MSPRKAPKSASLATASEGAKLCAPSAERNTSALCDLLEQVAPPEGAALELASGTGQHIVQFAERLPDLHWQPTEPDTTRRASIDAYVADSGLANVSPSLALNAAKHGWAASHPQQALVVVVNLLHLISTAEAKTLIAEAARALEPNGRFVIYGPFKRGGELTSDGDVRFHASLTAHDPEIGYKDDFDTLDMAQSAGLETLEIIEMPANNLALVFEKIAN